VSSSEKGEMSTYTRSIRRVLVDNPTLAMAFRAPIDWVARSSVFDVLQVLRMVSVEYVRYR
jgi:hypothetical protein